MFLQSKGRYVIFCFQNGDKKKVQGGPNKEGLVLLVETQVFLGLTADRFVNRLHI